MSRIVVVGSYAESLVNFRGDFMQRLVAKGHSVIACAPDASAQTRATLSGFGVEYRHINMQRTGVNPFKDLVLIRELRKVFVQEKAEICVLYTIKPVIFGSLAAYLASVEKRFSIITGLGYIFTDERQRGRLLYKIICTLYRLALRVNTKVFFQNPDDLAVFRSESIIAAEKPVKVVNGSGVDIDYFSMSPRSERESSSVSFLLIARLLFDKGIKEYAEAAGILKKRYPSACFRLAGWYDSNPSAVSRQEVEKWQREYGIEYLGRLDDVRPAIRQCSVYVLPSYREGTPRTVLEAMAMGRPVVTTDVPGCRETVVDGVNGFLVPARDSRGLAEAMEKYLVNPGLIEGMGRESRRIAVEKYDVKKVNGVLLSEMDVS